MFLKIIVLALNKKVYWIESDSIKKYNNTGDVMKLNRIQKVLMAIIGLSLSLSLIFNIVRISSPVSNLSREGYELFSMLKYTLIEYPVRSFTEGIQVFSRMWALEEENEMLRQQVEGIASMQARIADQQRQIKELQEMNDLKSIISNYETTPSTVLSRSSETWNNTMVIDIGSKDGVKENYAVITNKGLIGRVQTVSENTSIVKLLTIADGTNKVSVKIQISADIMADAILESYDYDEQAFVVKLLDSNNTVTENMTVTTSGMGGVFPSGLLVGKVSRVEELTNAIGMNVYVKPAADFNNLDYVYVVKRLGIDNE